MNMGERQRTKTLMRIASKGRVRDAGGVIVRERWGKHAFKHSKTNHNL